MSLTLPLVNHSISSTEQVLLVAIAHIVITRLSHCIAVYMITCYFLFSSWMTVDDCHPRFHSSRVCFLHVGIDYMAVCIHKLCISQQMVSQLHCSFPAFECR